MARAAIAAAAAALVTAHIAAQAPRPVPTAAWAAKPITPPDYPPGIRPWTRLADIKARHAADAAWQDVVVDDGRLAGEYVAAVPGAKTAKRFHPDTREWFAVVEGEVRVDIEGQEPFAARRGSLVNIPRQTIYSIETIGDKPSLRWVVNVARAKALFPREGEKPPMPPPGGTEWAAIRINRTPSQYDAFNQPHLNIHDAAAKSDKYTGGRFVRDDKSEMLVIYGYEKNLPPLDPADKGHFHAESAEMWLVFAGQIRYAFEGQQPFVASEGDVVYVPAGTWHATRFIGEAPACRLSITEYVGNSLLIEPR